MIINIQQAIYGELDSSKGYHLLDSSFKDSSIASRLSNITDLIDRPPNSILSKPVFRAFSVGEFFLFIKTFPDSSENVRSGRVFSHVLIIKINELIEVNNLKPLLELHLEKVDKHLNLEPIQLDISNSKEYISKFAPSQLASAINGLVNHSEFNNTIVWVGEEGYIDWINRIWLNIPNLVKPNIKLGVGYNPQKIDKNLLNLIYIPEEIKQNWVNYNFKIVDSNKIEDYETQTSYLLTGNIDKAKELNSLVNDFGLQINEIDDLLKLERVLPTYISISESKELIPLLIFVDLISKFSPNTKVAQEKKTDLLKTVASKFKYATHKEINAIPNINWSSFLNYKSILSNILINWLDDKLFLEETNTDIVKILEKTYLENKANWWRETIKTYFEDKIANWEEKYIISIINWFNSSPILVGIFESILPDYIENNFILYINKIDSKALKNLEELAINKNWIKFHASILSKLYPINIAINRQLKIENNENNFEGLQILASNFSSESFIDYSSQNPSESLIDFSVRLIVEKPKLLSKIKVNNEGWIEIWTLCEKQNISAYDYVINPLKLTYGILDELINGKKVEEFLLSKISKSKHSDLSNFKNRAKLWNFLSLTTRNNFIQNTSSFNKLEKVLLINQIVESENKLKKDISFSEHVNLLIEKTNDLNFTKLLILFESFNVEESMFLKYLGRKPGLFESDDCKRIGYLILKNNWFKSYKEIKNRILIENRGFQFTIEICNKDFFFRLGFGRKDNSNFDVQSTIKNQGNMDKKLPVVIILTAINEEYMAVRSHLNNIKRINKDDTIYELGIFELAGNIVAEVVIRECGPKNNIAAQETERAINNFLPDCMFYVGIAGSRKVNDFKVGDVIYPEKIYSYEAGKSEENSFSARPDLGTGSYAVSEMAKIERNKDDWKNLIKGGFDTEKIKANLGIIASGEQIVEHYDSHIGQVLTKYYNDTSAVEMEGFGFAKAAERQGRSKSKMLVGVVRGISDILERVGDSNNLEETDRRPDNAKALASNTAAAFAYWLIFNLYNNV
ncbi:hypothetical protein Q4512_06675 [Oceanihabitans sp. 2_MG-2023]|uniref:GAP1-N1 domain-containing protein n=1 Tax=Oceanihabitans sp. 2_MG-2023 TaxID=3062661 RepID=UPI0026E39468|nr:hypothetical protein [Oceanihabitans sp. 2_MG-2023]MDO6596592.1 hypothetical protein [Oceanihabitans sp. 2_MG-2023]